MEYKFYVKMDDDTFGPFSAKEILALDLMDDILVTEESMNGTWLPARRFDFQDMYLKESGTLINEDGSISRLEGSIQVENTSAPLEPEITSSFSPSQKDLSKWNWGGFFFNWLWAVCNGIHWPLVMFVLLLIPEWGSLLAGIADVAISIDLGLNGTKLAWEAKKWPSWESYSTTQHRWSLAALCILCIELVCGIVLFFIIKSYHG